MLDELMGTERGISPEKLGAIAEKGLDSVHLSEDEKRYMLDGGLEELYAIMDFEQTPIPALDTTTVTSLVNTFIPKRASVDEMDMVIRFGNGLIETIQLSVGWIKGSTAFASRESNTSTISFHKKVGKLTIHLEIVRRDERLADINVKVTDNSEIKGHVFDAELLKGDQCVEMIHTAKDTTASFYAVEIQDYILKVSDAKNEIASIAVHMNS